MLINNESIFCKCECGCCSLIEITHDTFQSGSNFNISLWKRHSGNNPMTKKERIRWCDHVMKTGQPWADHTIVTNKDAKRIVQFLSKRLAKYGKKTKSRK